MKNRTIKSFFSLILSLIMVMSLATTAFAAGPSIEFKGFTEGFEFEPGSEYTETDLFDNFKNVMPGDVLTEEISFTNSATDCDFINLYMRAVAHDEAGNPLSTNVAASGETVATISDFLAQLSMKVWNGTELIYDASPDELDGLQENKFLGTFRTGDTATLKVELSVPITLGNDFANRVGEVDWVFHVEAYNESQLSVRKIWSDGNANHTNDSIIVNLLKDGQVERSEILNAENQWAFTFDKLLEGHEWTVEEANVPVGYRVSYDTVGTTTTITNTLIPPPEHKVDVTVVKEWVNNGHTQPDSVKVQLYRNNVAYETVVLDDTNDWTYTWKNMSDNFSWSVRELEVPSGYNVGYSTRGNKTTITNTYDSGSTPDPEDTSLTVEKVWVDDGKDRPDHVEVDLLRNGHRYDTVTLDSSNGWTYTWDDLDGSYSWSAVEHDVPDDYDVSYKVKGTTVTITNTEKDVPSYPISLGVKKVWHDENSSAGRPGSVTVTLYDGDKAVDTVYLNASNHWSYTWENLSSNGNWQVVETNIPKGYTPSYSCKNGVVTITNTATLIQTGQLNWPIPVLGGLGVLLIAYGFIVMTKKRKNGRA